MRRSRDVFSEGGEDGMNSKKKRKGPQGYAAEVARISDIMRRFIRMDSVGKASINDMLWNIDRMIGPDEFRQMNRSLLKEYKMARRLKGLISCPHSPEVSEKAKELLGRYTERFKDSGEEEKMVAKSLDGLGSSEKDKLRALRVKLGKRYILDDGRRNLMIDLIYSTFKEDVKMGGEKGEKDESSSGMDEMLVSLASDMEQAIYVECKLRSVYQKTLLSRLQLLKKYRDARMALLAGELSVEDFISKRPQDFASSEVRDKWHEAEMEDRRKSTIHIPEANESSFLKCRICGKGGVTYNQAQTRSADEPMTVFYLYVFCWACLLHTLCE
jgi:DNA-directed RNA polymerase subunit M/transcription elongation factor TFIIS